MRVCVDMQSIVFVVVLLSAAALAKPAVVAEVVRDDPAFATCEDRVRQEDFPGAVFRFSFFSLFLSLS